MEYIFLSDVLTYIDDHIHEKISLKELAEMAGYSPFYFSKIFSETMGMPVTGYIRIRKLQYAIVDLLPDTAIFDNTPFSIELIQEWLDSKLMNLPQLCVRLEQQV